MSTGSHGSTCFTDPEAIIVPVTAMVNVRLKYVGNPFGGSADVFGDFTETLTPTQAVSYLHKAAGERGVVSSVILSGPGDPFAEPEKTIETATRISAEFPDAQIAVNSNGLMLAPFADDLARIGVYGVIMPMHAADTETLADIIYFVRPGRKTMPPHEGLKLLLEKQAEAAEAVRSNGLRLRIDTMLVPGVNVDAIGETAKRAAELGAELMHIYPCLGTVEHSDGEDEMEPPSRSMLAEARVKASAHIGVLDEAGEDAESTEVGRIMADAARAARFRIDDADPERSYVAVCSDENGKEVMHLGKSKYLLIYKRSEAGPVPHEIRPLPGKGTPDRWEMLKKILSDCRVLVAGSMGDKPREALADEPIELFLTEEPLNRVLDMVF